MAAVDEGQGESKTAGSVGSPTPPAPELVRRVADEVYQLFLRDLRLERERRGDYGPPGGVRSRLGSDRG